MPRNWLTMDPESLKGKIVLLVWDKLVLGAAIALCFIAYDRWKTTEQRAYEDRVTLAFQRANYIKELVPLVVDADDDIAARSQALIALIETRSLGTKNALGLTERLLREGLIRADYPEHLVWHRDHPVLDALETRMPSGLEPLLQHYTVTMVRNEERRLPPETRQDIDEFWSELFLRALDRHKDSELQALNSDEFLSKYLRIMAQLLKRPMENEKAEDWFASEVKGLRILSALRSVGEVGVHQHANGRRYLLSLLSPPILTEANLRLAGTVIDMQRDHEWASRALAIRCLEIVLRQDEDMRLHSSYYHRSLSAGSYLDWYATTTRDESKTPFAAGDGGRGWNEIEAPIAAGLASYLSRISTEEIAAPDFGPTIKRNSTALPLVAILLSGIERGEEASPATQQVLGEVSSLSDERLHSLRLDRIYFGSRWTAAFAADTSAASSAETP